MESVTLELMKHELNVHTTNTSYDKVFEPYIAMAERNIRRECMIDGSVEMNLLVAKYAAYLWSERKSGGPLPKMIRAMLNDITFKQRGDGIHE